MLSASKLHCFVGCTDGRWLLRLFRLEQLTLSPALRSLGGREREEAIRQRYRALSDEDKQSLRKRAAVYKLRVQQGDYHPLDRRAQRGDAIGGGGVATRVAASAASRTGAAKQRARASAATRATKSATRPTTTTTHRDADATTAVVVMPTLSLFQYFVREQRHNPAIVALASREERQQKLLAIYNTLPDTARRALEQRARDAAARAATARAMRTHGNGTSRARTDTTGNTVAARAPSTTAAETADTTAATTTTAAARTRRASRKKSTSRLRRTRAKAVDVTATTAEGAAATSTTSTVTASSRPRQVSAYARFVKAHMATVLHLPHTERLREVSRRWKALSSSERATWLTQQQQQQQASHVTSSSSDGDGGVAAVHVAIGETCRHDGGDDGDASGVDACRHAQASAPTPLASVLHTSTAAMTRTPADATTTTTTAAAAAADDDAADMPVRGDVTATVHTTPHVHIAHIAPLLPQPPPLQTAEAAGTVTTTATTMTTPVTSVTSVDGHGNSSNDHTSARTAS